MHIAHLSRSHPSDRSIGRYRTPFYEASLKRQREAASKGYQLVGEPAGIGPTMNGNIMEYQQTYRDINTYKH